MDHYYQPEWYKFSQDSLELVRFCKRKFNSQIKRGLDIGSGCGIIGLELLQCNIVSECSFIEKQIEFKKYLFQNIKNASLENYSTVLLGDIKDLSLVHEYELIISNPPYFFNDSGRSSDCLNKRICRSMDKDFLKVWKDFVLNHLMMNGFFIFSSRDNEWLDVFKDDLLLIERESNSSCIISMYQKKV